MSRRMLSLPPTVFFQLNKLSLYFVIQKENSVPEWFIKERTVSFVLGFPFESIVNADQRTHVMKAMLHFFEEK